MKTVHLAVTIIHELTHAAFGFLLNDDRLWLNGDKASETDLAYEISLSEESCAAIQTKRLYLESWPSFENWNAYVDDGKQRHRAARWPRRNPSSICIEELCSGRGLESTVR